MQAVPLAAINSSVMAAFKSPSLSPPSDDLAQTLGKMASVYEISATASSSSQTPQMSTLSSMEENLGEGMVAPYTTQYYSTVESQSRTSSISTDRAPSPRDSAGRMTPVSVGSSKEESTSSEGLSPLEDEGSEGLVHHHQGEGRGREGGGGGICIPSPSSEAQPGGTQVKHWTYEDQFKQLYNLSQEQERKEFLDMLFNFMQSKGSPITRVPIMAKQPLDLYKLFKLVVERGGLVEVIKKKAWRNVAKELNLPASITSAAFTMRSQYVKYLYPYECDTVHLSDPQELQMAIDSNKRDRRHDSESMDFISAPQLQRDMEMSPVVTTTPQGGLQIIGSPTMAFPHGSLPPYSGGFLVTGGPGGTHVVASPQLVQMAPHVQGIPIVMPSNPALPTSHPATPTSHSSLPHSSTCEDKDDIRSHGSGESVELLPPAAKRHAPDSGGGARSIIVSSSGGGAPSYSIHQTSAGNFIMAHGGVAASSGGPHLIQAHGGVTAPAGGPHLIQVTPHGQIPIVLPTTPTSNARDHHGCPAPPSSYVNGRNDSAHKQENGAPHPSTNVPPTATPPGLFQMAHHHSKIPGLIIPQIVGAGGGLVAATHPSGPAERRSDAEQGERYTRVHGTSITCGGGGGGDVGERSSGVYTTTTSGNGGGGVVKMPLANLSIQSAGGKIDGAGDESGGVDASLLVTLDINNTVYQGVLFAKPHSTSSSSPSQR